jgi:hypothetical protein
LKSQIDKKVLEGRYDKLSLHLSSSRHSSGEPGKQEGSKLDCLLIRGRQTIKRRENIVIRNKQNELNCLIFPRILEDCMTEKSEYTNVV